MAAIIGEAGLAATAQMRSVLTSQAHLTQSAVPMLALSQRIGRSLNGAFLLVEQLIQADAAVSPVSLEKELAIKIDEVFPATRSTVRGTITNVAAHYCRNAFEPSGDATCRYPNRSDP
mgnify:CR=1 FL=1